MTSDALSLIFYWQNYLFVTKNIQQLYQKEIIISCKHAYTSYTLFQNSKCCIISCNSVIVDEELASAISAKN